MASYLKPEDLSGFLRSRKSHSAKVMADWVDDNPDSPVTTEAVNRLERYLLSVANMTEMRHSALHHLNEHQGRDRVHNMPAFDALRKGAVMALVAPRYAETGPVWQGVHEAAEYWCNPKWAAWTAQLVRHLSSGGVPVKKEKPNDGNREHTVEFLIVKRVTVRELDEIQAEWRAANKLTDKQKRAVHQYRVLDEEGKPLFDWQPPNLSEWNLEGE
jgi:hypothetical protein